MDDPWGDDWVAGLFAAKLVNNCVVVFVIGILIVCALLGYLAWK
jgi:hypothetical protein